MVMQPPSEKFERQIERIHQLLENDGAQVTWNDRIPDPDNPSQVRQIDITIRRGNAITLVECRIHKERQDVKWIEELIGRRQSLRAHAVIAVSASGFTTGAIAKAESFGIILRSMGSLSEPEIRSWGKLTEVQLVYYEFTDCLMTFKLPPRSPFPRQLSLTKLDGTPVALRGVFEQLMRNLDDDRRLDDTAGTLSARVRRVRRDVEVVSVAVYGAPDSDSPDAHVATFDMGAFEILQSGDIVAVVADLSHVNPPPDCFFHGAGMDFGRIVTSKSMRSGPSMRFRVESSSQ